MELRVKSFDETRSPKQTIIFHIHSLSLSPLHIIVMTPTATSKFYDDLREKKQMVGIGNFEGKYFPTKFF